MLVCISQYQKLHDELNIDHAAGIVLEVKLTARVRVPSMHFATHT